MMLIAFNSLFTQLGSSEIVGGAMVPEEKMRDLLLIMSYIGGALFVAGGRVVLGNQASLRGNTAPKSEGKAIYSVVDLSYELPSPLATWVLTGGGSISSLGAGYIDDDFPYDCAAGLYGDSFSTFDQSGPHCSGSCPAGEYCEKRTTIPAVCAAGTYCPEGSASPVDCPDGTFASNASAESVDGCIECDSGLFCPAGSAAPQPCPIGTSGPEPRLGSCELCSPGSYQKLVGQTSCNECTPGGWCNEGAGAPEDCPEGTYSSEYGLVNSSQCSPCPIGYYCEPGASQPEPCPEGKVGLSAMLGSRLFCTDCPSLTTSTAGSSECEPTPPVATGCCYPSATNYDPSATVDDLSCVFDCVADGSTQWAPRWTSAVAKRAATAASSLIPRPSQSKRRRLPTIPRPRLRWW